MVTNNFKKLMIAFLCVFQMTLSSCGSNGVKNMIRNNNRDTKPEISSDSKSMDPQSKKPNKDEKSKESVNQEIEKDLNNYIVELGKASAEKEKYNKISDAVLLLGPTGCGKSTTINYLLGYKMIESSIPMKIEETTQNTQNDDGGYSSDEGDGTVTQSKRVIEVDMTNLDPRNVAGIGHDSISHTLYPKSYLSEDFTYCDCPGFFDNRSDVKLFATAIANNMLIRSVKNIKALVVATIFNNLSDNRGVVFIDGSIKSIQNTFKKYKVTDEGTKKVNDDGNEKQEIDPMKSVYFLFTKCPDKVSRSTIKNQIISMKNDFVEHIKDAPIKYKEYIFFLDKILENSGNILYIKPLDGGKTKEKALKSIRKSPGLVSGSFNFIGGDQTYRKLEVFGTMAIMKAQGPLSIVKDYGKDIKQRSQTLTQTKAQVDTAEKEIANCKKEIIIENERLEETKKNIEKEEKEQSENQTSSLKSQYINALQGILKSTKNNLTTHNSSLVKEQKKKKIANDNLNKYKTYIKDWALNKNMSPIERKFRDLRTKISEKRRLHDEVDYYKYGKTSLQYARGGWCESGWVGTSSYSFRYNSSYKIDHYEFNTGDNVWESSVNKKDYSISFDIVANKYTDDLCISCKHWELKVRYRNIDYYSYANNTISTNENTKIPRKNREIEDIKNMLKSKNPTVPINELKQWMLNIITDTTRLTNKYSGEVAELSAVSEFLEVNIQKCKRVINDTNKKIDDFNKNGLPKDKEEELIKEINKIKEATRKQLVATEEGTKKNIETNKKTIESNTVLISKSKKQITKLEEEIASKQKKITESHKKILKARPLLNLVKNIDKSIPLMQIKGLGDLYNDLEEYDKMKEEKSNENQKEEKKSDQ